MGLRWQDSDPWSRAERRRNSWSPTHASDKPHGRHLTDRGWTVVGWVTVILFFLLLAFVGGLETR